MKQVVTYRVDFSREWGEIKIGDKYPIDAISYDNQGRAILKWEPSDSYDQQDRGITQNIFWSDGEQTVKFSGAVTDYMRYYSPSEYTDKTYSYKYDGNNRLISVTISSPGQNESKVFFKYNPQGGYSSTVYESIDSYGDTRNYNRVDDWDNYYDDYVNHYDHEFKGYNSDWIVEKDTQGNWIKALRYSGRRDSRYLEEIIVREIEYYDSENIAQNVASENSNLNYNNLIDNAPAENRNIVIIEDVKPIPPKIERRNVDDDKVFTSVEQMPVYPGGDDALRADINKSIRYPQSAMENGIEGKVIVQFVVRTDGSIGEVKVVRGKNPELDNEAKRVIKTLKKFTPGKMNGNAVNVWYTTPITFKLQ